MNILAKIFSPIASIADRIICVVAAITLAQGPNYIAQYTDVLSGAEMEARKTYEEVQGRATAKSMSVDDYIAKTIDETPRGIEAWNFVQDSKKSVERYQNYHEALLALQNSSLWKRPFVLTYYYDASVHEAINFEPNVPITTEGAVYGLIGVLIALVAIGLVKALLNLIFGKKKKTVKT